jgi:hypothetical protein
VSPLRTACVEVKRDCAGSRVSGSLKLDCPRRGQLYNGRILAGILWLIFTLGCWIGTGGTPGPVPNNHSVHTAYSYDRDQRVRA